MEITPKLEFVSGSFNTEENIMVCVVSDKNGTVELCFKEDGCCWNIPIGEIKLFDSGKYVDFKATLDDAKKLGDEICRRWNECKDKR